MTWTRRQLGLSALAATLAPRVGRAAVPAAERCFLFLHCRGGWDPTCGLLPAFDAADMEPDAVESEAGGISFVDHAARPSVQRFFGAWGERTCLVHGVEVQSIAHERCHRIVLTGRGDAGADDWPSILAANAVGAPVLPHLLLAGGAFNRRYGDRVVRVGDRGQLPALLSGRAFEWGDVPVDRAPNDRIEALVDAALTARLQRLSPTLPSVDRKAFVDDYLTALDGAAAFAGQADGVDLAPPDLGCERDIVADASAAFDCFERGLSRTAMLAYDGWCAEGWDTHKDNSDQSRNFEDLFAYLDGVMADAAARPGLTGGSLLDDVTVVVFSEMGRSPRINPWGGKDHWTYTSVLLAGAGVRGGQVIGGVDRDARGLPVDLGTGAVSDTGTPLVAGTLGATLLKLGGVEPGDFVADAPLLAAVEGA